MEDPRYVHRRFGTHINRESASSRIKSRQFITLIADYRNAVCFEPLPCGRQVENDLRARADNNHWRSRELRKIRGDVGQRTAMYSADAARCEDFYARAIGDPDRGGDCRGSVPTLCDSHRDISRADFFDVVAVSE